MAGSLALPGQRSAGVQRLQATWSGSNRAVRIGIVMAGFIAVVMVLGPALVADPLETNLGQTNSAPSLSHLMGTDEFGRDVLARAVAATRLDITLGVTISVLAAAVGTIVGLIAGYMGRWIDEIIMRLTDVTLAFPGFVLAMIIVAVLGDSLLNLTLAVAAAYTPHFIRLIRAQVLSEREREYVQAARIAGNPEWRIAFRHVLPSVLGPSLVQASLVVGWAILTVAGLAFLGVGIQSPTPEWGIMVAEGANGIISGAWWTAFFPGLCIVFSVLAFQLLGEEGLSL